MNRKPKLSEYLDVVTPVVASRHGYGPRVDLGSCTGLRAEEWWFPHRSEELATELIGFQYYKAPQRYLGVEFLGSALPLKELMERGFSGSSIWCNLNQFQFYQLERDMRSLLPTDIPMNPPLVAHWDQVIARIEAELDSSQAAVWRYLRDVCRQQHEGKR